MPDLLEVAQQRKLIEDLQRGGQSTQEAESRLKDMLALITSFRCYGSGAVDRGVHKHERSGVDPREP